MTVQLSASTFTLMFMLMLISPVGSFAQQTPYAGQHTREIKALSPSDLQSYLSGHGMGLAKAVELNHYPGPKHVLELAEALHLTEQQRTQTQTIFDAMRQEAIQLGHQLIQAERHLDDLFSRQTVTEDALQEATRTIADYQGKLRNAHLRAHLAQRRVLNAEQIQHYDHLRGYAASTQTDHPHRHQH
ncbi:MAG: periplasmic heavy metal sensor [Candidatus Tectomicrobia bacterium]|nr:periplasmic heavy metal sensor [Candidatus Tectomicrobia bacterium]